jgi:hypothetical protein
MEWGVVAEMIKECGVCMQHYQQQQWFAAAHSCCIQSSAGSCKLQESQQHG